MIRFSDQRPKDVLFHEIDTPYGPALAGLAGEALCRLSFLHAETQSTILRRWKKEWPETVFQKADFTLNLTQPPDMILIGTAFQQTVWKALLKIKAGETETYAGLASKIGKPKAARAVGNALGANPIPLLIPCHRILASHGGLGGYSGGLGLKKILLAAEGQDPTP